MPQATYFALSTKTNETTEYKWKICDWVGVSGRYVQVAMYSEKYTAIQDSINERN